MTLALLAARTRQNHQPSGGGDPYWPNTVALTHLDGANNSLLLLDTVIRPSPIVWTTVSGAVASTTNYIFAGSSFHFDGVNGDIHTAVITDNVLAADFTIEGWANVDDLTQARCFFDTRVTPSVSNAIALAVETNGKVYLYTALDNIIHDGTITISVGSWFHWALCRNNGVIQLFVNGAVALTLANTTIFNTGRMMLGRSVDSSGFRWKGYLQEFRCLPYTAIYTAAFTPPTSPYVSAINSESHLLHLQGIAGATIVVNDANIFIPAWEPHTMGPKLSTTAAKFGVSSASFTSSMCMLQSPSTQYTMGSGDFTWELFFRYSSLAAYQTLICNRIDNGNHTDQITVGIESNGKVYVFSNAMLVEAASGIAVNTFAHIALSVQATVGRLFVNGTQVGNSFTCPTLASTGIAVGANINLTESFNGYIDEVRITKGVARYTSNFTAPTTSFPNHA